MQIRFKFDAHFGWVRGGQKFIINYEGRLVFDVIETKNLNSRKVCCFILYFYTYILIRNILYIGRRKTFKDKFLLLISKSMENYYLTFQRL